MSTFVDISGRKFNKLVAINVEGRNTANRLTWKCLCDCGEYTWATTNQLKTGRKKSCGCLRNVGYGEASFNQLFSLYQRGAKYRDLEFGLTKKKFRDLVTSDCYYCGCSPRTRYKSSGCNGVFIYNGIDRIDNKSGYMESNCVPCCDMCNKAKRTHTQEEFFEWIKRAYEHSFGRYK